MYRASRSSFFRKLDLQATPPHAVKACLLADQITRLRSVVAGWHSLQCQCLLPRIGAERQPVGNRRTNDVMHRTFTLRHKEGHSRGTCNVHAVMSILKPSSHDAVERRLPRNLKSPFVKYFIRKKQGGMKTFRLVSWWITV